MMRALLLLGLAAGICATMWCYADRVNAAHQVIEARSTGWPRGNLSDLYPRWLGARELLLHGRNPYSAEVTREIQAGYYGRPLDPSRPTDPKDQQAFAYPLYVVFLLAPTVSWPFAQVRLVYGVGLTLLTLATVWWWLRILNWKLTHLATITVALLMLGSFPFVQAYKLQQLTLLVAALLAAAVLFLVRGRPIAAGVLLAVATIKPQLVAPLLFALLVWTTGDWRSRQRWLWSFVATLAALTAAASALLPSWIPRFLAALRAYHIYTGKTLGLSSLLPGVLAVVVWAGTAVVFVLGIWPLRRTPESSPRFGVAIAWVLSMTLLLIPMFAAYNELLLLPGAFCILRSHEHLKRRSWLSRRSLLLFLVSLGWPWLAASVLCFARELAPHLVLDVLWLAPLYTTLMLPLVATGLLFALWRNPDLSLVGSPSQPASAVANPV
jgi:hypothetical protein